MIMKNSDVVKAFFLGNEAKTTNRWTNGSLLRNYSTLIAYKEDGKIKLNARKYSVTTSKLQNEIRRTAENCGWEVVEYVAEN